MSAPTIAELDALDPSACAEALAPLFEGARLGGDGTLDGAALEANMRAVGRDRRHAALVDGLKGAEATERFVGRVVNDFLDDMERILSPGVHARTLLDGL